MLGVLELQKALNLAFDQGLDLVEVSLMLHRQYVKLLIMENTSIKFKKNRQRQKNKKPLRLKR